MYETNWLAPNFSEPKSKHANKIWLSIDMSKSWPFQYL